jgi:hypothetical protein
MWWATLAAGLFAPALSEASSLTLETAHLIVSDSTDNLSDDRLRQLTDQAQETLNKVLQFWAADPRIREFGKIRITFAAPRKYDYYTSVFINYWDDKERRRVRIVRVFGAERAPLEMAHKLTSAIFPHKDKLIRNVMGIPTEEQVGNRLTHPGCGFSSDHWVLAFVRANMTIPLDELGPDGDSWGHPTGADGLPYVTDRAKHTKAYAEAGSFGNYLIRTYGISRVKQFYRLSLQKERPWRDIFGADMRELEASWLKALRAREPEMAKSVSTVLGLFEKDPNTACTVAQKLVTGNP